MSVARRGPAALPTTCEPASNDGHNGAVQSTLRPRGTWNARAITRCLEWLRAYRGVLQRVSCCRVEPLIPAHHHAFGNAFFRLAPETRRACPTAFWPHSAGSTASGRYYADDRPSSFPLRRNGIGAASGSPIIVDLAGAQAALSRMRGGYNKDAMRVARDDTH
jgi:hypothetical protein